jgi:cell shape-determining protein MreC
MIPVIGQDSRATGILRGGISGLSVTDLLIDATITTNESIVTSGLGGELPAGIPIGTIVEVQERKGDITKKASLRSPLDLSKLEMVFVRK